MPSSSVNASINHLPPEILSVIFTLVYLQTQHFGHVSFAEIVKAEVAGMPFPPSSNIWVPEDVLSPSLFPFALAAVCTTWRDTMSSLPEFWTRLVMFANKPTSFPSLPDLRSFAGLKQQVEWSNNLPLDVFITRLPDKGLDITAEDEGYILRKAIDILKPHVGRCKTINYNVVYSSSLPSIMTDLNHPTPLLSELRLNSVIYSDKTNELTLLSHPSNFYFPRLEYLALDGRNFMDFSTHVPDWVERIADPGEDDGTAVPLAITNYVEMDGGLSEGSTFWDKIADALPKISHLDLSSIVVPNPPKRRDPVGAPHPQLDCLEFLRVNPLLINEVLHNISYTETLNIISCGIGEGIDRAVDAFHLTLEAISDTQDISPFLSRWCGFELTVINCPSFNDAVLDILTNKSLNPNTTNLGSFYISDCANFTVTALKRFVERQKAKFAEFGDEDDDFSCLEVTGFGPPLSVTEREWFQLNIPQFAWETHMDEAPYCPIIPAFGSME